MPATILVAEDEPDLLVLLANFLEEEGYRVLRARDGAEALARLEHDHPDLLLTDERLPFLRGADLVAHLRAARDREVPAIVMSAYAPGALPPGTPFLSKPFAAADVLAAVDEALAVTPSPAEDDTPPPAPALEALARRFVVGVLNAGNLAAIQALVHPGYRDHGTPAEGGGGLAALPALLGPWRDAFPDLHFAVEECFADGGGCVTVSLVATGTHRGPFLGVAPTGWAIRTEGLAVYRFQRGRLVEHRAHFDTLGLLRQLGAAPPPG
jgi:steroid delta-isomerase-like uncharacterized protein